MWIGLLMICCADILLFRYCHQNIAVERGKVWRKSRDLVLIFLIAIFTIGFPKRFLHSLSDVTERYTVRYLLLYGLVVAVFLFIKPFCSLILRYKSFFIELSKILFIAGGYFFVIRKYFSGLEEAEKSNTRILWYFILLAILLLFSSYISKWLEKKEKYEYHTVLAALTPLWCFYVMEKVYNDGLDGMTWKVSIGNILCLAAIFFVCYMLIPKKKAAVGIFWTVFFAFGCVNYYVTRFRGSPIMPSDLFSAQTALQVAGNYEFEIPYAILVGTLHYFTVIVLLCLFPVQDIKGKWRYLVLKLGIGGLILYSVWNLKVEEIYQFRLVDQQWTIGNLYKTEGSFLSFLTLLQNFRIKKPENYKTQDAERILRKSEKYESDRKPTIIVIMDESFSDLQVLSDFYTSDESMRLWYERGDYLYRGNLYVSVFGGSTANSEFEFLTGNSLGNLPAGVVAYQLYDLKNVGNLAATLKEYGYRTTAIHPEYRGNWNRMRVYDNFGFETFLGIEDFEEPERLRYYVSDRASFEKVIEVFEEGDYPQFIFNVTMQNHGAYFIESLGDRDVIKLEERWQCYTDVETYLTIIRESDLAIDFLLEYFRTVDEPVVVCVFGDHQPAVNGMWIEDVMGKMTSELSLEEMQRKYMVPYMIWANYDTQKEQRNMDTSANYLGAILLDAVGIAPTGYGEFLLQMYEQIPAVNAFGYMTRDGGWHSFEEETEVSEWIRNYQMIQYDAMFDSKRNMEYYKP